MWVSIGACIHIYIYICIYACLTPAQKVEKQEDPGMVIYIYMVISISIYIYVYIEP